MEYTSNKIYELLTSYETIQRYSCAKWHCWKKLRHIVKITHSPLSTSITNEFLGKNVLTAICLINTILSSYISGLSHFEKLYQYSPAYYILKNFCCTYFVFFFEVEHNKLFSQFVICVFLGCVESKEGYRCFDPKTQSFGLFRAYTFLSFYFINSL